MSNLNTTIASAVTPAGRAAIATIVVQGNAAGALVRKHFRRSISKDAHGEWPIDRILFGTWSGGAPTARGGTSATGEEVVVCRRADFEGVQNIEIHCHGGAAAPQAILADLAEGGSQVVPWSEWIGAIATSPVVAEAHLALAHAPTLRTAQVLLDQQHGALQDTITDIVREVTSRSDEARVRLESLVETAHYGLHLTEPWSVAIVGPSNVGKSSLVNTIVGYQRAIVHDVPGTTRDVLTALTAIDGWPIEFADTAGIRATVDPIEALGVGLARDTAKRADCVLLVFDASQPWDQECEQFHERFASDQTIVVQNKLDLVSALPTDRRANVATSALRGDGIETLLHHISQTLVPNPPTPGQAVVFTARQLELVNLALDDLRQRQNRSAIDRLTMMESLAGR